MGRRADDLDEEPAAGGGLLHRRAFLSAGAIAAGAAGSAQAQAIGAQSPPWMTRPGVPGPPYGQPAHWRADVKRTFAALPGRPGTGASRTPHEALEGTITPAGLHFERHHSGVPDIDPERHELTVHGLVRRPLIFTLDTLLRYPMTSRVRFLECSGNSQSFIAKTAPQGPPGQLNGLVSCSEWTGVKLSTLLDEAGVDPRAAWVLAEGADAAGMSRSIPLWKCMDDAVIALFQNGEAIRPEQGFPMRLFLPGYEGNSNVKWLRRLKLTATPTYTKDETSKYTDLLPDGRARIFTLDMGVKSFITKPCFGRDMRGAGLYEVSGVAWTGAGRITRVDISADGGRSWAPAALTGGELSKSLVRFRLPWRWDGGPATLLSRAHDEKGQVQPTRDAWLAQYGPGQGYHYNAIQAWSVGADGAVRSVHV
jgi:sulfane dehydrogenase subunit SoxC